MPIGRMSGTPFKREGSRICKQNREPKYIAVGPMILKLPQHLSGIPKSVQGLNLA